MTRDTRSTIAILAAVALCLMGCTAGTSDRAGGRGLDEPTILEIAQPNDVAPAQVNAYAAEVEKLSHGSLRLHFSDFWRRGDVDYERKTLEDVASGKVQGAWVGVRSLDLIGVLSFRPLVAPLLVDSQAFQDRIFAEGIPQDLARGMEGHGLVSLAVLQGPLRKVLGVRKPFREPSDFKGSTLGVQDGLVMERTAEALGAKVKRMPTGAKLAGVDAYEQQIDTIYGNRYGPEAKYVTANVNLWPRMMTVVVNDGTYRSLTDAQREILGKAALTVIPAASEASRTEDDADVVKLCGQDVAFPVASEQQLADLRKAVQPVHEEIARDPAHVGMLRRLTVLKAEVGAEPDVSSCHQLRQDASGGAFPQGTYDMVLENDEFARCPGGNNHGTPKARTWFSLEVRNATVTVRARIDSPTAPADVRYTGTYSVVGEVVRINNLEATWSFDGTALRLVSMTGGSCDEVVVWTTHPWVVRSAAGQTKGGLPDGTYENVHTPDDLRLCDGQPGGANLNPDGHPKTSFNNFTLEHGTIRQYARVGSQSAPVELGWEGTYRVFRNVFELTENGTGGVNTATFTFDGKTLTLTPVDAWPCDDRVVWTLHPWTLTKKGS